MSAGRVRVVNGTVTLGSGTYTGRLIDGIPDGSGTCTWRDGTTYEGEFKQKARHGHGVCKDADGGTYNGDWVSERRQGWGVQHYACGSWYQGQWAMGTWVRGTYHDSNKVDVKYGEWKWDFVMEHILEGYVPPDEFYLQGWGVQGREVNRLDGSGSTMVAVYEGEWDRNEWHGKGTWVSPDGSGDIYHGMWDHGKRSGAGKMVFGEGGSYIGEWKDNKFHGRGVRLWANGDRYEGQWVDGKENGEGARTWSRDGSSFAGSWELGVPKRGMKRWPNGDLFEGAFTGGGGGGLELQGKGVATLPSSEGRNMVQLSGILNNNNIFQQSTFQQHKMGSPPFEMFEALKTEHTKEMNALKEVLNAAKKQHIKEINAAKKQWEVNETNQSQQLKQMNQTIEEMEQKLHKQIQLYEDETQLLPLKESSGITENKGTTVLPELMAAFKLATQFRSQLKQSAPEFVLLEESLNEITRNLQGAKQRNEELASHLRDLAVLKDTLGKQLEETRNTCKKVLGQTLTAQNSDAEIQQCSRNISELTKKVLGIKPVDGKVFEPSPPEGSDRLLNTSPDYFTSGATTPVEPFHFMASLTDTLMQLQECRFEESTKLADQHTTLSKELSEQVALGHNLHKQIEEMQVSSLELMREHKTKWVLRRGLEGDEQFIALPCVWSQLSQMLPQAQQAVFELIFAAKVTACGNQQPPANPSRVHCSNHLQISI
ncbi:membrane occupation and recognition nexus protein MORN1 [Pelomyxa schiedti]|nr:membrane occupation and recognition nexus protein MORN1 [Pelomyxa schiedti]